MSLNLFKFYGKILGGTVTTVMRWGDTPMKKNVPVRWHSKIVHSNMLIKGGGEISGSDSPPGTYVKPQGFHLSIALHNTKEAEKTFKSLAEGGTVEMPLEKTFWADAFGMVVDRFGIPWLVNSGPTAAEFAEK